MGIIQVLCMGYIAAVARSQELQECSVGTSSLTVGSTEDADNLADYVLCSNGDFNVQWDEEVFVTTTIRVSDGTSLNITGTGPGAIADGGGSTQLFVVEGGSTLHLSDMTLSNGSASSGGAISATDSSVSFSGNTSFSSNSANDSGGAIYAYYSTVWWDGDGTQFSYNSAKVDGGAIYANSSTVSWDGDDTQFSYNSAYDDGGAIYASDSLNVSWDGDGTQFSSNSA
ncbi:unnamed protein product, partial [Ectocarpus sp. 12 AP-2014]